MIKVRVLGQDEAASVHFECPFDSSWQKKTMKPRDHVCLQEAKCKCDERADDWQTNTCSVTWLARSRSSANTVSTTTRAASGGLVASDGGKRVGGVSSTSAREGRVGVRLDVQVAHGDVVALANTLELRSKAGIIRTGKYG